MPPAPLKKGVRPRRLVLGSRGVFVLITAAACAWYSVAATLPMVLGKSQPAVASVLGLTSAEVEAAQAHALLSAPAGSASFARATELATSAFAREVVQADALRALGQVAMLQRDPKRAERYFVASQFLSRREPAAQLWLLEDAVSRGDIAGALNHYDRALRTSQRMGSFLLPVLAAAMAQERVATELIPRVAARPPWWSAFFQQLISVSEPPSTGLAETARALDLDPENLGERQLLVAAMNRLVQNGDHRSAYALYQRASKSRGASAAVVRSGDFATVGVLPPFDWTFANEPDLSASIEPRSDSDTNSALHLNSNDGALGEYAHQVILLSAGRYQIAFEAGNVGSGVLSRPSVELICTAGSPGTGDAAIARFPLPAAPASGVRFQGSFKVPVGCTTARLVVRANGGQGAGSEPMPWIDTISVTRS